MQHESTMQTTYHQRLQLIPVQHVVHRRGASAHVALTAFLLASLTLIAGCSQAALEQERAIAEASVVEADKQKMIAEEQRRIAVQAAEARRTAEIAVQACEARNKAEIAVQNSQEKMLQVSQKALQQAQAGYEEARTLLAQTREKLEDYQWRLAQAKKDNDSLRSQLDAAIAKLKAAEAKSTDPEKTSLSD